MQRGFTPIIILIGILVIIAVASSAYYYVSCQYGIYVNGKCERWVPSPSSSQTKQSLIPPHSSDETANWKTYHDQTYNYSFRYPPQYAIPNEIFEIRDAFNYQGKTYISYEDFGTQIAIDSCAAGGIDGGSNCDNGIQKRVSLKNQYGIEAIELYLNKVTLHNGQETQKSIEGPLFIVNITRKDSKTYRVLFMGRQGNKNLFNQIFPTVTFINQNQPVTDLERSQDPCNAVNPPFQKMPNNQTSNSEGINPATNTQIISLAIQKVIVNKSQLRTAITWSGTGEDTKAYIVCKKASGTSTWQLIGRSNPIGDDKSYYQYDVDSMQPYDNVVYGVRVITNSGIYSEITVGK